jgi:chitinase/chitodextrinase
MNKATGSLRKHQKQVIGYVTQYDAWKEIPNLVPKGGYNQLNIDFSKYTILNFSFFGLAHDGSLHSADYRNKQIHLPEQIQEPAPLIHEDIYSSWDRYILFGAQQILWYVSEGSHAWSLGYRAADSGGWINVNTNESGDFPLAIEDPDGPPGLLRKAKQYGVKVMASLGGWSMSKHFPSVAKDPVKRQKLVAECRRLINMGFDGIDLDWEFPNGLGMNIIEHSPDDFKYFTILVDDIRKEIGNDHLITAATSTAIKLLEGFEWHRLNESMDYFNIMTYDINGGWSNIAGHNSPLYNYPGQEGGDEASSLDKTIRALKKWGVKESKINAGVAFYGRGVITEGTAALNQKTVKSVQNVPPDGSISTCGDFDNWPLNVWDGTPNYAMIVQKTREGEYDGWQYHWDENARVPYLTKGKYFLSYDNERSVGEKAKYVVDNNLAGVIIWTAYGDLQNLTTNTTVHGGKLVECHDATSILADKIDQVFSSDSPDIIDKPISLNVISPGDGEAFPPSIPIKVRVAVRAQGSPASVYFKVGDRQYPATVSETKRNTQDEVYYDGEISQLNTGQHTLAAIATDRQGKTHTSPLVAFSVMEQSQPPVELPAPHLSATQTGAPAHRVELTWSVNSRSSGLTFTLYRNQQAILTNTVNNSYIDSAVSTGTEYQYTVIASDNKGNQSPASNRVTVRISADQSDNNGQFPDISQKKIVMGFWHNWPQETHGGSGYRGGYFKNLELTEIPTAYNVIAIAFMKASQSDHIPDFAPYKGTAEEFRRQIETLHTQGRAVLISLGGADAHIELQNSDKAALKDRIIQLTETYGFDGLDIDLEQNAISAKDNATVIPQALKEVKDFYRQKGKNFIISMAPEFPYLRTGQNYEPYIQRLEGDYDFIAPQYYNQGGDGLWIDDVGYLKQDDDEQKEEFLYYLTESIVTGTRGFIKIPHQKFAIGLPANNDAARTGYVINPDHVKNALQRLDSQGLGIKGVMTWSINWDTGSDINREPYNWEFIKRYGWISEGEIPGPGPDPEPTPPAIPTGLRVTSFTSHSVTLDWTPSRTQVRDYTLYRDGSAIKSVTAPPFTDTGLSPNQTYNYQIKATNMQGVSSGLSAAVTARTSGSTEPDSPWQDGNIWYPDNSKVSWQGVTWLCVMQHTSNPFWSPDKATSLWKRQ